MSKTPGRRPAPLAARVALLLGTILLMGLVFEVGILFHPLVELLFKLALPSSFLDFRVEKHLVIDSFIGFIA